MKKIYSLALALFMGVGVFAQTDATFVFTDASGNIIPDGTTLNVNNYEVDDFTEEVMFPSGLFVKNNSDGNAFAGMKVTISSLDNGILQHCFPGNCQTYDAPQTVLSKDGKGLKPGESQSINSEWLPKAKGNCSVTYTIRVMKQVKPVPPSYSELAVGHSVTVNYIYDNNSKDVAGISNVTVDQATDNTIYNLAGQRVSDNYKGVLIKKGKKYLSK